MKTTRLTPLFAGLGLALALLVIVSANSFPADATTTVRANITYASPDGNCGGNTPCFNNIQAALYGVVDGGTVNLGAGEYDYLSIDQDVTVNANGNIILNSELYLYGGTFNAPSGTLTVKGNISNSGGTFNHNNGTVRFDGSRTQYLHGTLHFHNVILGPQSDLELGLEPLHFDGTLTNQGVMR
jgi:hypothetical protein